MAYLQDVCRPFLQQQDNGASGFNPRGSQASATPSGTSTSISEAAPAVAEFLDGVPDGGPLPVIEPLSNVADMIDELVPCDLPRQGVENASFFANERHNWQPQRHTRTSGQGTNTACLLNYSESLPHEPHQLQGRSYQPLSDPYLYMQQLLEIAPLSHSFPSCTLDPLHPHSRILSTIAPATVPPPPTKYSTTSVVTAPPTVNPVVFDPSGSNTSSNIPGARTFGRGKQTACLLNRSESLPYEPYELPGSPIQPLDDQNQHMQQKHIITPLSRSFPSCAPDPLHPHSRIASTTVLASSAQYSAASVAMAPPAVSPVVINSSRSNNNSTIRRTRTTASAGARGRGQGKQNSQRGARNSWKGKVAAPKASTSAAPSHKSRTEGVLRQVMSRSQEHNIKEKERRKTTNEHFNTMRSLIPAFQSLDPGKMIKIDKATVVDEMYKYIVSAKDELEMLEKKLEQFKTSASGMEQSHGKCSTNMAMPRLTCADHTGDPAALTAVTTTSSARSESCQNSYLGTSVSFHVTNRSCAVTITASRHLEGLSARVIATLESYHVQIASIAIFVCDETRSQSLQCKIDASLEMEWGDVHSSVQRVVNDFIASASSSDAYSA